MGGTSSKHPQRRVANETDSDDDDDGDLVAPPGLCVGGFDGGAPGEAAVLSPEERVAALRADFFLSCKEGRLDDAKRQLASLPDMDVNMTDPAGGATALQWACYKGQLEVAQWLLGLGARADTANSAGADSLQLSAKTGNATLVQLIIDAGADVHHLDRFSKTALHYAAYLGRAEACDVLLQAGAGVDAVAVEGGTPMLHAAKAGNVDVLRVLLRYGADPGLKDKDGMTPREAAKGKGIDIDNF